MMRQRQRAGKHDHLLLFACCLSSFLASCARLAPPLSERPLAPARITLPAGPSSPAPGVRLVEARPGGLLLTVALEPAQLALPWARLSLLKLDEASEGGAAPLYTARRDATSEQQLLEGLALYDQELRVEHTYIYALRLHDAQEGELWQSEPVSIRWQPAPEAPAELSVVALSEDAVELSWEPKPGWGVVVVRRELGGEPQASVARVELEATRRPPLLDRDVRPATVYAYRLAYARRLDAADPNSTLLIGSPSAERYAALPAVAPALIEKGR